MATSAMLTSVKIFFILVKFELVIKFAGAKIRVLFEFSKFFCLFITIMMIIGEE